MKLVTRWQNTTDWKYSRVWCWGEYFELIVRLKKFSSRKYFYFILSNKHNWDKRINEDVTALIRTYGENRNARGILVWTSELKKSHYCLNADDRSYVVPWRELGINGIHKRHGISWKLRDFYFNVKGMRLDVVISVNIKIIVFWIWRRVVRLHRIWAEVSFCSEYVGSRFSRKLVP